MIYLCAIASISAFFCIFTAEAAAPGYQRKTAANALRPRVVVCDEQPKNCYTVTYCANNASVIPGSDPKTPGQAPQALPPVPYPGYQYPTYSSSRSSSSLFISSTPTQSVSTPSASSGGKGLKVREDSSRARKERDAAFSDPDSNSGSALVSDGIDVEARSLDIELLPEEDQAATPPPPPMERLGSDARPHSAPSASDSYLDQLGPMRFRRDAFIQTTSTPWCSLGSNVYAQITSDGQTDKSTQKTILSLVKNTVTSLNSQAPKDQTTFMPASGGVVRSQFAQQNGDRIIINEGSDGNLTWSSAIKGMTAVNEWMTVGKGGGQACVVQIYEGSRVVGKVIIN